MNAYTGGFSAGMRPQERLDVAEWADRHRILPAGTAEPGRWRTSRVPYMREPMRELSALSDTQRIILMFASQTAKTSTGENWLGYLVSHSPGDILVVQPTTARAEWFSKRRVSPMLAASPVFRGLVADERSRDSSNTIMMKSFLGGTLTMVGANSPVGLKSDSIQYLFLDEVDGYPSDVGEEGDPIALAEMRTITFPRSKILITSTPTVAETSRIEREYLASDQRKYFVPCPECGWMQELRWRGSKNDEGKEHREYRLVWADDAHTVACYTCEDCGVLIEERFKTRMLEAGEWRAQAPNDGRVKGYHLNALYSPYGWKSWRKILEDFERAAKDAPLLKTFVNSTLAETWEENYSMRIDADGIAARAEMYSMLTVPEGGLVITAGIDVQDNRLEIVQRAWGEGEESWLVNYSIIHGDPGQAALWAQALDVLDMVFQVECGGRLTTLAAAVDTGGHYTHEAYAFCRQHRARRILAIKGASQHGKPAIGKPVLQDINFKNQVIKNGIELWPVGTDTIKSVIYGRLKNPDPGPGAYHWPIGLHADYFKQLTAEKQSRKYVGGFPKLVWVKKSSDANEALDVECYAYAALQYLYTRTNRVTFWDQMRKRLWAQPAAAEITDESPENMAAVVNKPAVKRAPVRRQGGFVKGWRH